MLLAIATRVNPCMAFYWCRFKQGDYSCGCHTCFQIWNCAEATKGEVMGEIENNITMHHSPQNYNGSAKLMEACSNVSMVTSMYKDGNKCIDGLLGNDDATMHSNCKHVHKEVMTFIENSYFIVLSLIIGPCWFTRTNKED